MSSVKAKDSFLKGAFILGMASCVSKKNTLSQSKRQSPIFSLLSALSKRIIAMRFQRLS